MYVYPGIYELMWVYTSAYKYEYVRVCMSISLDIQKNYITKTYKSRG
jgi:hypothetical protein